MGSGFATAPAGSSPRLAWLALFRVGGLFSPAADAVAGACVAGAAETAPVLRCAAASAMLYAAGMAWNDYSDRARDAVERPERPLPRGEISPLAALSAGAALALSGVLLSPVPLAHAGILALVLLYDFAAKHRVLTACLVMGSARGLNLASGAFAVAGAAGGPWLVAAAAYSAYIAAVTMLASFERRPPRAARTVAAVQAGALLAAISGVRAVQGSIWPAPLLALGAALPVAAAASRTPAGDRQSIRKATVRFLLGTMVYDALLCAAAGSPVVAIGVALAVWPSRAISRRLSWT
ncbi:MAG: UbiA family prenyltransferase [Planctomycetota bacterium]